LFDPPGRILPFRGIIQAGDTPPATPNARSACGPATGRSRSFMTNGARYPPWHHCTLPVTSESSLTISIFMAWGAFHVEEMS